MAAHVSWLRWKRIRLQCGRPGFNSWVGKIPWQRERLPTPVFWPEEFHGLYSPWSHEELDTTEQLSLLNVNAFCLRQFYCLIVLAGTSTGELNTSSEVGFPLWSLILEGKLSGFHC